MRDVNPTKDYEDDVEREEKGKDSKKLRKHLQKVIDMLQNDERLPVNFRDHKLSSGKWKDCRECHIGFDLVLIYRKPNRTDLDLVRLGTHSRLGLS